MNHLRRRIISAMAAAGLISGIPLASAQAPVKLTLAHNLTPGSPKGMGASKFAELVSAKSNGRITVNVAPNEQLGNENTNMAAMRTDTLDLGSIGQGAMLSVVPEVAAIGLPFLYSSLQRSLGFARWPDRPGAREKTGNEESGFSRLVVQRHPANDQQQAADHQAGRLEGSEDPHPS